MPHRAGFPRTCTAQQPSPCNASQHSDDSLDYGQGGWGADTAAAAGPACTQAVWGVVAALPKLARLRLDVAVNYHTPMPDGTPALPALTHLAVQTDASMTAPATLAGGDVPLLEVRGVLWLADADCGSSNCNSDVDCGSSNCCADSCAPLHVVCLQGGQAGGFAL
jgi:hypothetical protein